MTEKIYHAIQMSPKFKLLTKLIICQNLNKNAKYSQIFIRMWEIALPELFLNLNYEKISIYIKYIKINDIFISITIKFSVKNPQSRNCEVIRSF